MCWYLLFVVFFCFIYFLYCYILCFYYREKYKILLFLICWFGCGFWCWICCGVCGVVIKFIDFFDVYFIKVFFLINGSLFVFWNDCWKFIFSEGIFLIVYYGFIIVRKV